MIFGQGDEVFHSKIQFSFKYRFVNGDALNENFSFFDKLYLGYTQKSFWDLESESFPFRDNNYNPELFYLQREVFRDTFSGNVRMDFQAGYEHESNGENDEESRSWDRLYLMPSWVFGSPTNYNFTVAPKVWAIIAEGDIPEEGMADYYGYGELMLRYGKNDSFVIDTMLRKGMEDSNGAIRVNVSYPTNRLFFKKLNLYLFGQVFYGEGESLQYYNKHSTFWRLGIALSR